MSRAVKCAECGAPMTLRTGKFGKFYGCTRFPECRGIHGAHQDSGLPLGKPADKATRQARIAAHDAFDSIWKGGAMRRAQAYKRLAVALAIKAEKCHIGNFDEATCNRVVEIVRSGALLEAAKEG